MQGLEQFMINLVNYYGDSCKVKILQIGENNYRYTLEYSHSSRTRFISRSKAERLLLYEQSRADKRIDEDIEEMFRKHSLPREKDISTYLDSIKL